MFLSKNGLPSRRGRRIKAALLSAVWGLLSVQVSALPVLGQDAPAPAHQARIVVNSDPSGLPVLLNGQRTDASTPAVMDINPGQYVMTVNAEGYQPLSHDLAVAAGEHLELEFILLETPPEPPTAEELRALSPPLGADDPNAAYWAEKGPRHLANDACKGCHDPILKLHAQGEHRTLACEDCHSALAEHVRDDEVIGVSQVVRGEGIKGLCLTCHDRNNRNKTKEPAKTILLPGHLQEKRVNVENLCQQCHHVHDPLKWMHEAREMVGLPEMMASIPLLDNSTAVEKQEKYTSMAETFLVFPMAPGVLGMALSENDGKFPAEALLISGAALVLLSYTMGKLSYSREMDKITALNAERTAANVKVRDHNLLIKRAMSDHEDEVTKWVMESEGRGMVVIRTP